MGKLSSHLQQLKKHPNEDPIHQEGKEWSSRRGAKHFREIMLKKAGQGDATSSHTLIWEADGQL